MMRTLVIALLACSSVFATACSPQLGREELELLKKDDAEFNNRVILKSEADREIEGLGSELASTKAIFDTRKKELQASFDQEAARIGGQITVLKTKILSIQDLYKADIAELSGTAEAKKRQLSELGSALRELKDVLDKKGALDLSSKESRNWEERRESLESRMEALNAEIRKFESQIAIKRKKLRYLQAAAI